MKTMWTRIGVMTAVVMLAAGVSVASAATITLSSITATWQNVVGGGGGSTISTPGLLGATTSVRWPTQGTQSGYDFTVAGDPIVVALPPDPSPFTLGTFNHLNFPIVSGSGISSVQLALSAVIDVDGTNFGVRNFLFDFNHFETPNGDNPCANGEANNQGVNINGCADRVTFGTNNLSENFLVDGVLYTVNIRGFVLAPDGPTLTEFWTIENSNNNATLVGSVERVQQVPEPALMLLVGMGLVGVGARLRRQ